MFRSLTLVLVLMAAATAVAEDPQTTSAPTDEAKMQQNEDGKLVPVRVKLETTLGDLVLELDAERAPISVNNFLQYVEDGFYVGTIFHRVINNFMIQGGGFTAEMTDKKEGLYPPIKNEWNNGLKNRRGTIAMARTQVADSATAGFYINVVDNNMLDQPRDGAAYAVFGEVVEGMDTADKIKDTKVVRHPKYPSPQPVTPETPVVINAAKIVGDYDRGPLARRVAELMKAERDARAAAEAAKMKEMQEAIAKLEEKAGQKVQKTDSGLTYIIIKEGDGSSPQPTDTVEVHYTGTFLDGRKFDSSVDRGKPTRFPLDGVIKGWTEGVGMMKVGGKRYLVIPPDLAYGAGGRGSIPPNSTLVFEVELLAINP